ncbi:sterol desaturase family protein [Streptomyces cinereoruber]|uniref:sterol desaturase family protein n=1 Tax=Streptomyces cinereoruber TaxID=67260 RepID=UPI003633F068
MESFPNIMLWALPGFLGLVLVEFLVHAKKPNPRLRGYEKRDTITSGVMGAGSLLLDLLWKIPATAAYSAIYAATPLRISFAGLTILAILLGQDFFYYWSHRAHHMIRILWASHVVHHSSRHFNLSTAIRQSWTGFTAWIFYIPLIGLGVHPAALAFCSSMNLIYQFWIHTEKIKRLPYILELLFNTPSHHRVHHASQGSYLDRNFGGIMIVWDRIFKTFEPEVLRCDYGLTKNISTYNPLRVATHEYAQILRDLRRSSGARERTGHLVCSPKWSASHRNLQEKRRPE